ncbi:hypothetical protein UE98_19065 [Burkholderia cenocepacia]|nr:hypothetical protein UE98_19065 [Burkholderia cenocepacia]
MDILVGGDGRFWHIFHHFTNFFEIGFWLLLLVDFHWCLVEVLLRLGQTWLLDSLLASLIENLWRFSWCLLHALTLCLLYIHRHGNIGFRWCLVLYLLFSLNHPFVALPRQVHVNHWQWWWQF